MFDPKRFLRLARAQWAEQRRAYLWFIGIGVMVHFVVLLLLMSLGRVATNSLLAKDGQLAIYLVGLYLTAPIFAARYFIAMSRPDAAGVLLMRPASVVEKWLLAGVVILVAYPLAYTLAFQVCNVPAALLAQAAHEAYLLSPEAKSDDQALLAYMGEFGVMAPWKAFEHWRALLTIVLSLAALQGFAVLGSLYFRTMPAIKTVLVAFVLLLVILLVTGLADARPDHFLGYWEESTEAIGWRGVFHPVAWFAIPGLLWLGALFALREREVA